MKEDEEVEKIINACTSEIETSHSIWVANYFIYLARLNKQKLSRWKLMEMIYTADKIHLNRTGRKLLETEDSYTVYEGTPYYHHILDNLNNLNFEIDWKGTWMLDYIIFHKNGRPFLIMENRVEYLDLLNQVFREVFYKNKKKFILPVHMEEKGGSILSALDKIVFRFFHSRFVFIVRFVMIPCLVGFVCAVLSRFLMH